jgi:hypothetical protein
MKSSFGPRRSSNLVGTEHDRVDLEQQLVDEVSRKRLVWCLDLVCYVHAGVPHGTRS